MLLVSLFSPFPYPAGRAPAEASKEAPHRKCQQGNWTLPFAPSIFGFGEGKRQPAGKKVCTLRFLTIGIDSKTLHATTEDV